MRRLISLAILHAVVLPAVAQQLAVRLAGVQNGDATFSFPARPDVCGDGHILLLRWLDHDSQQVVFFDQGWSIGTVDTRGQRCTHGPVRVRLSLRDGRIRQLQPAVGATGRGRGRDLGVVGTREAVDFLLDLAARASQDVSTQALLGAALADSVTISMRLLTIADDQRLPAANRGAALQ